MTGNKLTLTQLDSCNDRELDALIVETITHESTCPWYGSVPADDVPLYSTDVSLARLMLDKWLKNNNYEYSAWICSSVSDGIYTVSITIPVYLDKTIITSGKNLARAICLAVLLIEQEKYE